MSALPPVQLRLVINAAISGCLDFTNAIVESLVCSWGIKLVEDDASGVSEVFDGVVDGLSGDSGVVSEGVASGF